METPSSAWVARQVQPLLIRDILTHVRTWTPNQKIVYRDQRELSYAEFMDRVEQLAHVLTELGVRPGDRIGVMDWDSHRYLELFFAVPMLGAVLHTVNVRLTPEQIAYTILHAEDSLVLFHPDFLPIAEGLAPRLGCVRKWVSLSDQGESPRTTLSLAGDYETLLAAAPKGFTFPDLDENTVATLFYTTGTTGEPKGVFFTHRQIMLHTLTVGMTFAAHDKPVSLRASDVYLPLTPMFHVHAWGIPYLATLLGLKQVYPGRYEPQMLLDLIQRHQTTFSHCVPTILQMLLHHPNSSAVDLSCMKIVIGGAALPKGLALQAQARGIRILGGYGMSETCPVVAVSLLKPEHQISDPTTQLDIVTRTGFPVPLVQVGIWGSDGQLLPPGKDQIGELVLRCPWLTAGYHRDPERSAQLWQGGWLHTGDIAYVDPEGYIHITDRLKDVVKIGGEWISSIELENALSQHEAVREVAVVGRPDPKWDERPHAEVVLKEGFNGQITERDLGKFLHRFIDTGALHKRAVLTEIRFATALPRTSVGKVDKKALRAALAGS